MAMSISECTVAVCALRDLILFDIACSNEVNDGAVLRRVVVTCCTFSENGLSNASVVIVCLLVFVITPPALV